MLSGLAEYFNLDDARIKWKLHGVRATPCWAPVPRTRKPSTTSWATSCPRIPPWPIRSWSSSAIASCNGGEQFSRSVRIDEGVIASIGPPFRCPCTTRRTSSASHCRPQSVPHGPADKNVAVFDTAFHQTLPEESLPLRCPTKSIAGTASVVTARPRHLPPLHRRRDRQALGKPLHELQHHQLPPGQRNGASVCAIKNGGPSTPPWGADPAGRAGDGAPAPGDIDPAIVFFARQPGFSVDKINQVLTAESGLLTTERAATAATSPATTPPTPVPSVRWMSSPIALPKYVGACAAAMDGRLDALVFTGGISGKRRHGARDGAGPTGPARLQDRQEANSAAVLGGEGPITVEGSRRLALVMPTNEELVIARDALSLVG